MNERISRVLAAGLALSLGCVFAAPALAQDAPPEPPKVRQPRVKPKPTQPAPEQPVEDEDAVDPAKPADPSHPAKPAAPTATAPVVQPPAPAGSPPKVTSPGPYIAREKPKDWTLTVNVTVRPETSQYTKPGAKDPSPDMRAFNFDTLAMVFPLPAETSSARPDPFSLRGKLLINDRPAIDSKNNPVAPVILDKQISGELYHSGTQLMKFGLDQKTACREIGMEFAIEYRCWNTVFDEEAAMQVGWPTGELPDVVKATMAPQMFIDYTKTRGDGGPVTAEFDKKVIAELVRSYTGGNSKGAKPVAAAKYIAGRIASEFQTSGVGLRFLNTGELQGFDLQGVPQTVQSHRGSEFDINSVVVAAFRSAGLPARLIIGYDLGGDDKQPQDFLAQTNQRSAKLRCWTEFGLYDEARRTLTWIPVDVVRMRKVSSRMGALDRPWKYFGTHEELSRVVPLAFGFHPPTTVESYGAPGMWGWLMTPQPPDTAYQTIKFRATSTTKTSADTEKEKDAKKKKKEKDGKY